MDVDQGRLAGDLANFLLEDTGGAVCVAQAGCFVDLEMQFDEKSAFEHVRRELVDGQALALRNGTDGFEEVFAATGARLHVYDDVGRHNLGDAFFNRFAGGMSLFETHGARNVDGDIDEITLAGATDADTIGADDVIHLVHGFFDTLAQTGRRDVEKGVGGAFGEPGADPKDHAGDGESGDRVEIFEPRHVKFQAEPCAGDADDDDKSAPNVSGEMQCVRFQGFAGIFFEYASERAGAHPIDSHGDGQDYDRGDAGLKVHFVEEKPTNCFVDDVDRGHYQQARFDESGEAFDFGVAVEVVGVGRFIGYADGKIGYYGGDEVKTGVQHFGENSKAARGNSEEGFQDDQEDRRPHRGQRRHFFLADCVGHGFWAAIIGRFRECGD